MQRALATEIRGFEVLRSLAARLRVLNAVCVCSFGGPAVFLCLGLAPCAGLLVSFVPWVVAMARSDFLIIGAWLGRTLDDCGKKSARHKLTISRGRDGRDWVMRRSLWPFSRMF